MTVARHWRSARNLADCLPVYAAIDPTILAELNGANKRCTALTCSAQEDLRTHAHVNILNAQARWSMVAETRRSTLEINIIKHRLKSFESINI
jgi:hypothetical protein